MCAIHFGSSHFGSSVRSHFGSSQGYYPKFAQLSHFPCTMSAPRSLCPLMHPAVCLDVAPDPRAAISAHCRVTERRGDRLAVAPAMATGSASLRCSEEESVALDVQMMPHESDTCPPVVSPKDIDNILRPQQSQLYFYPSSTCINASKTTMD